MVEVEEEGKEDGQEEGEEVESGEGRVKEKQPPHTWMDMECEVKRLAQNLSQRM